MRRAFLRNPSKVIGITLATVFVTGALFCAGFIFAPNGMSKASETKAMEQTVEYSAPEQKEQTVKIEVQEPEEQTLNREEGKSTISASKQSSLEKAVDDLIELTEGE